MHAMNGLGIFNLWLNFHMDKTALSLAYNLINPHRRKYGVRVCLCVCDVAINTKIPFSFHAIMIVCVSVYLSLSVSVCVCVRT